MPTREQIEKMRVDYWDGGYPGTITEWNALHDQALRALDQPREPVVCPMCKGSKKVMVTSFADSTKLIVNSCKVCKGTGLLQNCEPRSSEPAPVGDLAMMLRRMIWMVHKRDVDDDSLTIIAGKAEGLLRTLGLQGSPLRGADIPAAPRAGGKDGSDEI